MALNASLRVMMQAMYQIANAQIVDGPGWMETELYDVDAKAEHVQPPWTNFTKYFVTCLRIGFCQLKFHRGTKALQAYVPGRPTKEVTIEVSRRVNAN